MAGYQAALFYHFGSCLQMSLTSGQEGIGFGVMLNIYSKEGSRAVCNNTRALPVREQLQFSYQSFFLTAREPAA